MLGVGSCDGMSRAKHRLGRGATGSDRRDPQSVMCRQHIVRDIGKSGMLLVRFRGATAGGVFMRLRRRFRCMRAMWGILLESVIKRLGALFEILRDSVQK